MIVSRISPNLQESTKRTLSNLDWLREHEQELRELFPETWTHIDNIDALPLGFQIKALGIDWRTDIDFAVVMQFLEKAGIVLSEGFTIRRNPHVPNFENLGK